MPHYRIYELSDDGKIVVGISVDVADDEAATQHAMKSVGHKGIEVWQDTRRVLTIKAASGRIRKD